MEFNNYDEKMAKLTSSLRSITQKIHTLVGAEIAKEGTDSVPGEVAMLYVEGMNLLEKVTACLGERAKLEHDRKEELDEIKKQNEEILHNLSCLQGQIGDLEKTMNKSNRSKQAE